MKRPMGFVTFVSLVMACGARTELDVPRPGDASARDAHDAAHDAHDAALDAEDATFVPPQAVCVVPNEAKPETVCSVNVLVGDILTPSGCINEYSVATGEVGRIDYACDGKSKWAAATFGDLVLLGSVTDGTFVDVCFGTHYPFQDGAACGWTKSVWSTSQRIYGDVTSTELTYTYGEKMIEGHSCWIPCTATAAIAIQ